MQDYVKLCIRENNPDRVIIHVGTNKLDSQRETEMIAKSIRDAPKSIRVNPAQAVYQKQSNGATTLIIKRWMSMMNFQKCAERLIQIS